jgi:3-oxoacyl-[acyl-carrier-protein] synthase II
VSIATAITGVGMVTPLGASADQTWQALLAGKSIRDHSRVRIEGTSRATALAMQAADEAVAQAGWRISNEPIALIVGTSKGPIESWIAPPLSTSYKVKAAGRSDFGLAEVAAEVAEHLHLPDGPRLTVSAACASGLHALIRAAMMIRSGEVSRAFVVAAEASVHPLFVGSFRRLGVLCDEGVPCRPFDVNRSGFLMSEAAAGICLERDPKARPLAAVERFAMGGDAIHLTAGDPSGTVLRRLLKQVVNDQPVDLIHAHATGTQLHDAVELAAIVDLCPDNSPIIYSHKAALGHSLGAAGLVSIVINCLCHGGGRVPANVNTTHPMPAAGLTLSQQEVRRSVRRSIACASGFGGPTAVVSLIGGA